MKRLFALLMLLSMVGGYLMAGIPGTPLTHCTCSGFTKVFYCQMFLL